MYVYHCVKCFHFQCVTATNKSTYNNNTLCHKLIYKNENTFGKCHIKFVNSSSRYAIWLLWQRTLVQAECEMHFAF